MANNLTGYYDAVVQISLRQLNGLLATLHQNGASDDPPLRLGHHGMLRVGDPPKSPSDEFRLSFRKWIRDFQMAGGPGRLDELHAHLAVSAPPGASRVIEDTFAKLGKVKPRKEVPGKAPEHVRGRVKFQLSSPTVSVTSGATSEVTLQAGVRAHYDPDPGTMDVALPKHPLRGEVRAVFELGISPSGTGRQLSIRPSSNDSKIQFVAAPGTNLSATEVARISTEIRKVIRDHFTPLPVDLPPDFPFSEFKALGSGSGQLIALPVQVSGSPVPAGHVQSIDHSFVESSGFALAASKEYVEGLLDPLFESVRDAIRDFRRQITVGVTVFGVPLTQTITFTLQRKSGPTLSWASGTIKLSASLKLVVRPGPDVSFTFTQKFKLALDAPTQSVTLEPDGDPTVDTDLPFNFLHDAFENEIKGARDQALSAGPTPVNEVVNQVFDGAKKKLVKGLRAFDESASATFTAVKVTADGLIVRGEIGSAPRPAPVVEIHETDDGRTYTALASWIPGGRVDRFIWSWVELSRNPTELLSDTRRSFTAEHRFTFPKPAGIAGLGSVSLRIEGTQTGSDGQVVSVTGESTPQLRDAFGPIMVVPSWWEPVIVPVWLPDAAPGAALKDRIAGHITLQSGTPPSSALTHNSLVYFPDWRRDKPLEPVLRVMAAMKRQKVSLVLIVVLPEGAFDGSRSAAEAKLRGIAERFAGRFMLTEDSEGGWTRTFAAARKPAAHLINARREFVWKHDGEIDAEAMAAALDKHILPAPAPRSRPLRLAVSQCCGKRAPDVSFEDHRGRRFALHRMRGREVQLNFWLAWSAPCIKELLRLHALQKQAGARSPFIVAFHGGKDGKALNELRKRHGLTFPLVQDADQAIARQFGVNCWPTTVSITADGFVSRVQFGLGPGDPTPPRGKKTAST